MIDPKIINAMQKAQTEFLEFDLKTVAAAKALRQRFYHARNQMEAEGHELLPLARSLKFTVRDTQLFIQAQEDPLDGL